MNGKSKYYLMEIKRFCDEMRKFHRYVMEEMDNMSMQELTESLHILSEFDILMRTRDSNICKRLRSILKDDPLCEKEMKQKLGEEVFKSLFDE